jgi:hypothetical protein
MVIESRYPSKVRSYFFVFSIALLSLSFADQTNASGSYCTNTWQSIHHGVFRDRSGAVIRKMPVTHGVIVDSNALSLYVNTIGRRAADIEKIVHRIRKVRRHNLKAEGQFRMYVADKTALEVGGSSGPDRQGFPFPTETRRIELSTERDSREYKSIITKLDELGVGRKKNSTGDADREIVADAFFARTARSEVATFLTADRGIILPLCNLSPACKRSIAKGTVEVDTEEGFVVEIPDHAGQLRSLRILPLFGR